MLLFFWLTVIPRCHTICIVNNDLEIVMKSIFPIIVTALALAGCQTTGAQYSSAQSFNDSKEVSSVYPYDKQYERYKDVIKTPLRDFEVYDEFTLVNEEEWTKLTEYHNSYITGRWPEDRGKSDWEIRQGINPAKCIDSSKNFTTEAGPSTKTYDWHHVVASCTSILFGRFYNDPYKGAAELKEVMLYWYENDILKNMNQRESTLPKNVATNMSYAVMSKVGQMMGHFSLYHRYYNMTEQEYETIDKLFTEFVTTYNYYKSFDRKGDFTRTVCNLSGKSNTVRTTNDHCGSFNIRIATGATLYGLEFGNQTVYDYGIRRLEITLATFDKHHGYSSQMGRGTLAIGYARQIVGPLDQLTYAFDKAFDFDFANMELHRSTTPNKVYVQLLNFANDPSLFLHYKVTDKRGKQFKNYVKRIKERKASKQSVWDAFNLSEYYIHGGSLAKNNYEEIDIKRYHVGGRNLVRSGMSVERAIQIETSVLVGFNPYVLRDATNNW